MSSILRVSRHVVIPPIMQIRVIAPKTAAAAGWWVVAGKTCVAAYQPKGAASLAASYTNLAQPGVNDAAPGVAPTFDAATGWTFDGTQWLTTGITTLVMPTLSIFVRFSDYLDVATNTVLCGSVSSAKVIYVSASYDSDFNRRGYRNGGADKLNTGKQSSGVMGLAGDVGYLNGANDGAITTGAGNATSALYIAARNNSGSPDYMPKTKIQAMAVYSDVLTAGEVATLSAAMAAL